MRFLLDTDHISILQRRTGAEYAALASRMAMHMAADFAFSIISFHEQALGAHTFIIRAKSTADVIRGYVLFGEILQGFRNAPALLFDAAASAVFDGLRAQRIRVSTMDLRIAAIALAQGLTSLSRNLADFSQVPGLVTEDWTT